MNSDIIRRKEARERSLQFFDDNSGDLGGNAVLSAQFAIIQTELTTIDTAMAEQVASGGDAGQAFEGKDTKREDLSADLHQITRTARRMEYQFDGISDKFRMPRNRSDQEMLATARAWVNDLPGFSADFISYGMPATFVADLEVKADAFDNSIDPASSAVADRVEATAEIGVSDRTGMIALRICDGIIQNIYAGNPGKLAAWLSASHVERG